MARSSSTSRKRARYGSCSVAGWHPRCAINLGRRPRHRETRCGGRGPANGTVPSLGPLGRPSMSRVTFVQQLHLVGFTTDHQSLIFSVRRGAKSGSFRIAVDESLVAAFEEAKAWLESMAEQGDGEDGAESEAHEQVDRPQSALSVREVQALLRRGLSVE